MVEDPGDYYWSSYQCNALGKVSGLLNPHKEYLALGKSTDERLNNYRELFRHHVDEEMITDIREAVNKGIAIGSEGFKEQIERRYHRRVVPGKAGRPRIEG
ncbi:transposase [Oleiphilus sp. HI0081]|jgi:putative transposase|uniref:transposase n=1 Tax=unclassified Oleiphilus TaxID=2631174 RepID=UPI0007C33508|nr:MULTISPECIES: transposase [unclassified Oleiphilus]KZY75898.1 transposase [Oleiphilus sp. HI0069]KZY77169.1 transposase [Oleiphilus sp. HI0068]KZY86200.1 transposase [Oleiphilus sp. HI0072]KZZ21020.1 transposase [Oleiphilus sp. HI0078]KZZ30143.1 transposase [Oleiphilus sp. HI0081]